MRPEREGVEAPLPPERVERADVRVHVKHPVGVRRVSLAGPLLRAGILLQRHGGALRLVVHGVEAHHLLEHVEHVLVPRRVERGLEERLEYVPQHLREVPHELQLPEERVEPGHLDEPPHLLAADLVAPEPRGELPPLLRLFAVDGDAPLREDELRLLVGLHHLQSELRQEAALDVVVALQKDLAQPLVAEGVVLRVEAVEAAEGVVLPLAGADGGHAAQAVGVDVHGVLDAGVGEDLAELELAAALHDHGRVHLLAHLPPDELHELPLREGGGVVDVGVHLADLVPVAAVHLALALRLARGVAVRVQLEAQLQLVQPGAAEGGAAAVQHRAQDLRVVPAELLHAHERAAAHEAAGGVARGEDAILEGQPQRVVAGRRHTGERVPDYAPPVPGGAEAAVAVELREHGGELLLRLGLLAEPHGVGLHVLDGFRAYVLPTDGQAVQQPLSCPAGLGPVPEVVGLADEDLSVTAADGRAVRIANFLAERHVRLAAGP
mmetsp:Transcript_66967/g.207527  ORF Transcript_66967/g.207527 Transcript_66967/m.207527 type:complete len:494 (-) Transcript_66967:20-1501(-)